MGVVQLLSGRYRLVERLGGGGMSVVWRAYDEVLGRQVAVKVLANEQVPDAAARACIRTEAQAAARLTHPNITNVHDYGESPGESGESVPYVVMELVPGPTLAQRLADGRLPVPAALLICAQVAAALSAAHAHGLVHRDIKPGNVMLSPAGAKVMDFGIAAIAGEWNASPCDGELWGTPAYLAPERLSGGEVVPASDVYGLGLLLYRVLGGGLPWQAETVTEMLNAHQHIEPEPLPEIAGVPAAVADLCRSCVAKQPDERPTASEAARILAEAIGWYAISETDGQNVADGNTDNDLVPVVLAWRAKAPPGGDGAGRAKASADSTMAARSSPATMGTQRWRMATVGSALVALTVGLVAGFFAAGPGPNTPGRPDPGPRRLSTSQTPDGQGDRPASPSAEPTPPTTGTAQSRMAGGNLVLGAPPVERTIATKGGTVTGRCVGSTASLLSWDPAPNFTATQTNPGQDGRVGLVFTAVGTRIPVIMGCRDGVPDWWVP